MRWQEDEISRLELIKKLFGDFIEDRRGDRVGLILFGSQAYLQAPLTFDRHTVRVWLDEAQIGIAGKNTAIGDAIGLAVKRLRQRPAESRVLVLITDGANTGGQIAPQIAAQLAAEQQVKIYTIGIGADPQQGGVPGLFGFNPGLDLDEPTLRGIAEITGGEYFRARSSAELESISATLDRLEPVAQQTTRARPALALYSWPLAAALGLSMLRSFYEHRPAREPAQRSVLVEAGWPWRLLFLNNNLHLVHHDLPGLPWYLLPRVYSASRRAYRRRSGDFHLPGYGRLWRRHGWRPVDAPVHPEH
ncbi:VWFA-related Acidobacterial domain protein [Pseudomonas aeruginosa]|nr:VWFA-related Acidobacterial domain protein [Pseudomonas aeruginosa]